MSWNFVVIVFYGRLFENQWFKTLLERQAFFSLQKRNQSITFGAEFNVVFHNIKKKKKAGGEGR